MYVTSGVGQVNKNFSWLDYDSHRLVRGSKYAYQVTATYRVKDSVTGVISPLESNGSSPDAVVGIPAPPGIANADPTFADTTSLVPQNILRGTSTGTLQFTVNDTESAPADLVVTAAKIPNNTPLAAELNVVVGGTGANRTVRVFHTVPLIPTTALSRYS